MSSPSSLRPLPSRRWTHEILLGIVGVLSGASARLNYLASTIETRGGMSVAGLVWQVTGWAILGTVGMFALRMAIRKGVRRLDVDQGKYRRWDTASYLVFLLSLLGAVGVLFNLAVVAAMWGAFGLWQAILLYRCSAGAARGRVFVSNGWLAFLFLISGFAALIYQIAWQRVLFTLFGVNIESVTVIVSIFMLGLGVGSLAGGWVSRRLPRHLPQLFFAFEIGIAGFGIVSVPLIRTVGDATFQLPLAGIAVVVYALLALPTMLMGATLPILVEYLTRRDPRVGRQSGLLYAANTLGSAIACFATAGLLFAVFGLKGAVYTAAAANLATGLLVYRYCKRKEIMEVR